MIWSPPALKSRNPHASGEDARQGHSLGITPANLNAQVVIHQAVVTNTAPVGVNTIGTNIITVFSGVGTLVTCDVIVWQQSSLVS